MNKIRKVVHFYRKIYSILKGRKLKIKPTIISIDCIGGALYSDYNLQFTSPTINLEFNNDDFILFCNHLNDFLNTNLEDVSDENHSYPLGRLENKYGSIMIHFKHYKSFSEALECWNRRKKRVDYNNIFIIMCIGPNGDEEIVKRFGTIKFDNKILLSSNIDIDKYPYCFNMKCYEYGYKDSLIQHINKYSLKRYLDEFDWLHFFKGKD